MFSKKEWGLILFNIFYISGFAIYYVLNRNYEFLWYVAVMLFFFGILIYTLRRVQFSLPLLWGLSIWGLLHVAGGGIKVGGDVLYAYVLLPLVNNGELLLLKYDQVVHAYGFAMATLVAWHLMERYVKPNYRGLAYYLILITAGMGLGALNEIVEFIAVLLFAETGVGGYFNTSLDLVFNTIGAIVAALGVYGYEKRKVSTSLSQAAVTP